MGAALTYARRYALFTLVGIAGEDDLDAPDLTTPPNKTPSLETPKAHGNGQLNGAQHKARRCMAGAMQTYASKPNQSSEPKRRRNCGIG